MRPGRAVPGLLAAGVILALILMMRPGGGLWGPSDPAPRDIALAGALPSGPLRITAFGTSLTAPPQIWPDRLAADLAACRGAPVSLSRVAGPGMGSAWALDQTDRVAATEPDLILVEFAINDADLLDGVSRAKGRTQHRALIAALRAGAPEAQILLMTMSPATGPRGWIRPGLAGHYGQYPAIASEAGVGLLDLYPRWQASPRAARGLEEDGLHPDPAVAARVAVPAILTHLGCGAEGGGGG